MENLQTPLSMCLHMVFDLWIRLYILNLFHMIDLVFVVEVSIIEHEKLRRATMLRGHANDHIHELGKISVNFNF